MIAIDNKLNSSKIILDSLSYVLYNGYMIRSGQQSNQSRKAKGEKMKQIVNFNQFCDSFRDMGRDNNFSYEGKLALFSYLEEYEDSTGEEIEMDIIALCCEYTEYKDLKEFQGDYSTDYKNLEDIEYKTQVIPWEEGEGFIIQAF